MFLLFSNCTSDSTVQNCAILMSFQFVLMGCTVVLDKFSNQSPPKSGGHYCLCDLWSVDD